MTGAWSDQSLINASAQRRQSPRSKPRSSLVDRRQAHPERPWATFEQKQWTPMDRVFDLQSALIWTVAPPFFAADRQRIAIAEFAA